MIGCGVSSFLFMQLFYISQKKASYMQIDFL